MKHSRLFRFVLAGIAFTVSPDVFAHDGAGGHTHADISTNTLPVRIELKGPVAVAAGAKLAADAKASGQGYWRFVAATDLLPLPPAVVGNIVQAHGTLIVDAERDI